MRRNFKYIFMFLILVFNFTSYANENNLLKVDAVVENKTEGGGYFLKFSIQNIGTKYLKLYRNSLPWIERPGHLYLEAIVLNQSFTKLNSTGRLHNTAGIVTLSPNQEISGSIKLRFSGLADALLKNSVAVLWVYIPVSPDEGKLAKVSGVAIIDSTSIQYQSINPTTQ